MKKIIFMVIGFYPVLFIIDKIQSTNLMGSYHNFVMEYGLLGIVVLLTYWLVKRDVTFRYKELDNIRLLQYFAEVRRWENTPYVPPITLAYLKNPPGPHSPFTSDYVNDTFYRTVVNDFRDKVYILMDFDSFEPSKRPSYLSVIGGKNIARIVFYFFAPVIWLYAMLHTNFGGWEVLTLPFVVVSFYRAAMIISACVQYMPTHLDHKLEFEDVNRKVTWRDAFPDRPVGETFLRAYYVEMERRSRFEAQMQGRVVPMDMAIWKNPNFPPYLYPAANIPTWENEYEGLYSEKMNSVAHAQNNVISLHHKTAR